MSTDTTPSTGGLQPPKPTTRNSIRQSLNLSSMGKALADVMNKSEQRGPAEKMKKAKDPGSTPSSRRTSAIGLPHSSMSAVGRSSIGDAKSTVSRRDSKGESRTVTRETRRTSASMKPLTASVDELGVTSTESITPPKARMTRSSSLRPRPSQTTALPKYRPKSIVADSSKKPGTPPRIGTRRKLSTSTDDEMEEKGLAKSSTSVTLQSPANKSSRPISPLPLRASALTVNLTSAINITPSTPERKSKIISPQTNISPRKSSARPIKTAKTSPTTSARPSAIARPSSSSSSRTTPPTTPRTPKRPSALRAALGFGRSGDKSNSPLRGSARSSPTPESPPVKHLRAEPISRTPTASSSSTSHEPADHSEDSFDVDDVEMLLAPTASLAAPTPALPRLQPSRSRRQDLSATPSRVHTSGQLPARSYLSYTSPLPPTAEESPSVRQLDEKGSLMSWDQLAKQSSMTMTEEEAESMITGLDLPFKSSSLSPGTPPAQVDVILESPCLSAMPSPGGYASLSGVLLPDVTPSPAVYDENRYENVPEIPAVDAAIVTLLRLQLASAENTAKERLYQLQSLEEQLHTSKESRLREADELAKHVSYLEQQLRGAVEAREKVNEERATYTASLEDRLRHAEAFRDQAIEAAVAKTEEQARVSRAVALQMEQRKWELSCVARRVTAEWNNVHSLAEDELDSIKGDRHTLTVLLAGLDQCQRQMCQASA